jgi:hypothetical protein
MISDKGKIAQSAPLRIAYGAIIIALAVALGYALALVPNVELVTLTLAFGGYLLGAGWGAVVGAIGFGLYSVLSPYGIAPPPLLFAQIIGGGVIGFGGSILRRLDARKFAFMVFAAIIGLTITLSYDILTNIGSFIMISSQTTLIPFIIGGLSFSVLHIVANTVIFAVLFPVISRFVRRDKEG